jgi:hypothetical protein
MPATHDSDAKYMSLRAQRSNLQPLRPGPGIATHALERASTRARVGPGGADAPHNDRPQPARQGGTTGLAPPRLTLAAHFRQGPTNRKPAAPCDEKSAQRISHDPPRLSIGGRKPLSPWCRSLPRQWTRTRPNRHQPPPNRTRPKRRSGGWSRPPTPDHEPPSLSRSPAASPPPTGPGSAGSYPPAPTAGWDRRCPHPAPDTARSAPHQAAARQ